jgi:hypothetical protein
MASTTTLKAKKGVYPLLLMFIAALAGCYNAAMMPASRDPRLLLVAVDGKYGYRRTDGNMVIEPCSPVKTGDFSEGLAAMPDPCDNGRRWGYIDASGKFMIKPQFRTAEAFSEGLAAVQIGEKWGFIDKNGTIVINPEYLAVGRFSEGLAWVRVCGQHDGSYTCPYGYIDRQGKMVIAPFTFSTGTFSEGLAVIEIDGKYGYVDRYGHMVIEPQLDFSAQPFSEGLARVRLDGKFGYIDKAGNLKIDATFDAAGTFSEGLAYASVNGKYGFIDKSGAFVISPAYDLILVDTGFHQGRACVGTGEENNEFFHYIDKTGKRITKEAYDWCGNFNGGFAPVDIEGERLYINTKGQRIW